MKYLNDIIQLSGSKISGSKKMEQLDDGDILAMLNISDVGLYLVHFVLVMLDCQMQQSGRGQSEDLRQAIQAVKQAFRQAKSLDQTGLMLRVDSALMAALFVRRESERFNIDWDSDDVSRVIEGGTEAERMILGMLCRNVALAFAKDRRVLPELRELVADLATVRTVDDLDGALFKDFRRRLQQLLA